MHPEQLPYPVGCSGNVLDRLDQGQLDETVGRVSHPSIEPQTTVTASEQSNQLEASGTFQLRDVLHGSYLLRYFLEQPRPVVLE